MQEGAAMVETRSKNVTEGEFMALSHDLGHIELVGGEVRTVPTGMEHEDIGAILMYLLTPCVWKVGRIYGSSAGYRLPNGDIRVPDVSFIRRERLPDGVSPRTFFDGAPDLAIEIISPSEDRADSAAKVAEYLEAGAQEVWQVYPDVRRVVVFRSLDDVHTYAADEEIDGGDLLPGFRSPVSRFFALD
jgi:Uma2 family endonuclease